VRRTFFSCSKNSIVRAYFGDDAEAVRLVGTERLTKQQQFRSSLVPHDTWQKQGRAGFRAEPEVDKRHLEGGAAPGKHQIAMEQHGDTDPHGEAIYRCNKRFAGLTDGEQKLHDRAFRTGGRSSEKIGQVVAAGEAVRSAADQNHPYRIVTIGLSQAIGQSLIHGQIKGVLLVRAVDAQR